MNSEAFQEDKWQIRHFSRWCTR